MGRARIPIGLGLIVGALGAIAATAALIHLPWWFTARADVTELALRVNRASIADVQARMSALLDDLLATQRTLAHGLRFGSVDVRDQDRAARLFAAFMANRPAIAAIELGRTDDGALGALSLPGGELATAVVAPAGQGLLRTLHPFAGGTPSVDPVPDDARVSRQLWFKQAFAEDAASWSDIYRMVGTGRLGFTVSGRVAMPDGSAAALAVSTELARVSAFLDGIDATPNAAVFLTNRLGELLAMRGAEAMPDGSGPGATRLADAASPTLRMAGQALDRDGAALRDLAGPLQIDFESAGERYFVTLAPLSRMGMIVGLAVPESDILGDIRANARRLGLALAGFVVLVAAAVSMLARHTLARPLQAVAHNALRLGDFRFDAMRPVASRLAEIGTLAQAIAQMGASLASFRKYIPTEVVRTLFAAGIEAEPGGERRRLTVLFMDLADFTRIAEALGEDLIPFLGEYLSEMSEEIERGQGTIDKYIGDAIMAFWGAPLRAEDHALRACRTALACQARLEALSERSLAAGRPAMRARIGINTGDVLVGNVGSRERLNYTVIGDPVNVASRLEALNKRYGTAILVGEDTFLAVRDHVVARPVDRVAVYGRAEGVEVYELLALSADATSALRSWVETYARGVAALRARRWDEAETLFAEVVRLRGRDVPATLLAERARAYRAAPPPANWDGVVALSEK